MKVTVLVVDKLLAKIPLQISLIEDKLPLLCTGTLLEKNKEIVIRFITLSHYSLLYYLQQSFLLIVSFILVCSTLFFLVKQPTVLLSLCIWKREHNP